MGAPSVHTSVPVVSMEAPTVIRRVLPNGLTLLVVEDRSRPLVAFDAVVRTGSATEASFLGTGVSHVVEHMLFKGTARRPVGTVEREAQSYGGSAQGYTTYDTTSYPLTVNQEHWEKAADLLVDVLFLPSMDPGEFSKEKEVVLRELKLRDDDPDRLVWDLLFENAYRIHPYRLPIIGLEPLLRSLTREDLVEYHRLRYRPNATVIAVVGDVEPNAVIRRFEELTASIVPGRIPPDALPEEPLPAASRELAQEADVELGYVAVGFPGVAILDPDLHALDLLAWILGGGRGSWMEKALKDTGIVHSVHCSSYTPFSRGLWVTTMRMDPERIPDAVRGAFQQIDRCQQELIPEVELEQAKRAFLREYLAARQTVGGVASDLATYETLAGDPAFAAQYLEKIQQLRPEDLRSAAQAHLKPEWATVVKLFPRGSHRVVEGKKEKSAPISSIRKKELGNGLRVLLAPDHRLPLVTFQVSLIGGVRSETEADNGISQLLAQMWLRGTRKRGAESLVESIRAMGGQIAPFSGRNSMGLHLEVVRSEAPEGLKLLGEILRESVFPVEELEKERRLALARLRASEEDPFSWGMRRLMAVLFSVHPYRLDPLGDSEALARLTREDLIRFYRRILDPRRMVVSVVGDFDPDEILPVVESIVGSLQAQEDTQFSIPKEPVLTQRRERQESTPRREALVMIGFPGLKVGDPQVPALDLIEGLLSGGAGRLFTEVREKRGMAYTVGAFAVHGVDPGAFVLYAVTDPVHLETVREALLEETGRLALAPVLQEELDRVREGILGGRRIARQAQATLAAQIGMDELYGLGYDFSERYEAHIKAVRPEEIQVLAKSLLDPKRSVVLVGRSGGDGGKEGR